MRLTTAAPPRLAMNARRSISIGMKRLLQDRNPAQRKDRTSHITVRWSGTVAVCRPIVNRRSCAVRHAVTLAIGAIALLGVATLLGKALTQRSVWQLLSPLVSAQTRELMAEARVRELVRQAAREAKGDPTETVLRLDRRVRDRWGDFESFPLSIVRNDDLLVTLTAPYLSFRNSLVDML